MGLRPSDFRCTILLLSVLSACSTERETEPPRTANEQLLISSAVDHALDGLQLNIPPNTKIWVNADYMDGLDQKYAVGAIRDYLLRRGGLLVADQAAADTVVEIRAGALSTNSNDMLIGLPSMALPIPFTGAAKTPELSLFKESERQGVAKLGITAYDAKSGALAPYSPAAPAYGFATVKRWLVLSLISWDEDDLLPKAAEDARDRSESNTR